MLKKISIQVDQSYSIDGSLHLVGAPQTIVFTHGISEYGQRHSYLVDLLGDKFNILFWDLRGHGRTTELKGYIKDFTTFEQDLETCVRYVHSLEHESEVLLMGHSMGALIALGAINHSEYLKQNIKKTFLSAPALGVGDSLGIFLQNKLSASAIQLLGKFIGRIPLRGTVDVSMLSHDPNIEELYKSDKMMLKKLSGKLLFELLARGKQLRDQDYRYPGRLKIVVGSSDKIVSISEIQKYCKSHEIELDVIENGLHEMHFEIPQIRDTYFQKLQEFFSVT